MFRACLLLMLLADTDLEEAIQSLANKIASHLAPAESVRLAVHNISSFPEADVTNVRAGLARSLRKRGRSTGIADITISISENVKGYLVVAEIRKKNANAVEMVSLKRSSLPSPPPLLAISKRLVWEQPEPILDLVEAGDRMLVLSPSRIARYERRLGKWLVVESAELAVPAIRDPRGRMEMEQERVNVFLPGAVCRGTWEPLKLACELATADFTLDGAPVHFTPARNTIEGAHRAAFQAGFGDVISICGNKTLASSASAPDTTDTVAIYNGAVAMSEMSEFPGPITALWPAPDGALAVAKNLTTKNYAAYALSVDCGH